MRRYHRTSSPPDFVVLGLLVLGLVVRTANPRDTSPGTYIPADSSPGRATIMFLYRTTKTGPRDSSPRTTRLMQGEHRYADGIQVEHLHADVIQVEHWNADGIQGEHLHADGIQFI